MAHTPGIDLLAFETVPCLKELRAIARLLKVPFAGSCSSCWYKLYALTRQ